LLLFRHTLRGQAKDYLFRQLTERGIPGQRIDLRQASVANGGFHLPTYHEIDVSLDPFPWSGHATTLESLWMGAPVVTLYGNCHAGRLAASVLTQLGLKELIAVTPEEYITAAVKLASDLEVLSVLRSRLRQLMLASPLCDGKAFTRDLEAAYRIMWRRWCAVSK
jgi:predicted O-linked N-acetylglucosamine transferase (SPINDLY family)